MSICVANTFSARPRLEDRSFGMKTEEDLHEFTMRKLAVFAIYQPNDDYFFLVIILRIIYISKKIRILK